MTQLAVRVLFADPKYNYITNVNPGLSFEEATAYFIGKWFNLGHIEDNMQRCIHAVAGKTDEL